MGLSEARLLANRANAQKSTGPRSSAGKATSARNRLAHGMRATHILLRDESKLEWDRHRAGVRAALEPQNYLELEIADDVAVALWRLRRAARSEAGLAAQRDLIVGARVDEQFEDILGQLPLMLPEPLLRYERSAQGMLMRMIGVLREVRALGSFGKNAPSAEFVRSDASTVAPDLDAPDSSTS